MENLMSLLASVKPYMSKEQLDEQFKVIAYELLGNYIIVKGEKKYAIHEIEFYYHGEKYDDLRKGAKTWTLTLKRTCPVGQWWFHDYGIDLTFESDKDKGYGGGILIAAIEDVDNPGVIIERGTKVVDCLFPHWSAFDHKIENACLVKHEIAHRYFIDGGTTRKINDPYKSEWRYTTKPKS